MAINSIRDEFIGESLEIVNSTNKSLIGIKGIIVDETLATFKIEYNNSIKVILKNGSIFKIGSIEVQGSKIIKRPEDRIKVKLH